MNKRGPKPSGVETDVLYKRVPKAEKKVLVEMVDAAMSKTLKAWSERNHEYLKKGDWYLNQLNEDIKANGGIRPSQSSNGLESKGKGVLEVAAGPTEITLLKREVDVAKDQEKKAWDEVTRLQQEVDRLEKEAQDFNDKEMGWYVSDESEKVRLMAGLLKKAKSTTNEYDQG